MLYSLWLKSMPFCPHLILYASTTATPRWATVTSLDSDYQLQQRYCFQTGTCGVLLLPHKTPSCWPRILAGAAIAYYHCYTNVRRCCLILEELALSYNVGFSSVTEMTLIASFMFRSLLHSDAQPFFYLRSLRVCCRVEWSVATSGWRLIRTEAGGATNLFYYFLWGLFLISGTRSTFIVVCFAPGSVLSLFSLFLSSCQGGNSVWRAWRVFDQRLILPESCPHLFHWLRLIAASDLIMSV